MTNEIIKNGIKLRNQLNEQDLAGSCKRRHSEKNQQPNHSVSMTLTELPLELVLNILGWLAKDDLKPTVMFNDVSFVEKDGKWRNYL